MATHAVTVSIGKVLRGWLYQSVLDPVRERTRTPSHAELQIALVKTFTGRRTAAAAWNEPSTNLVQTYRTRSNNTKENIRSAAPENPSSGSFLIEQLGLSYYCKCNFHTNFELATGCSVLSTSICNSRPENTEIDKKFAVITKFLITITRLVYVQCLRCRTAAAHWTAQNVDHHDCIVDSTTYRPISSCADSFLIIPHFNHLRACSFICINSN